MAIDGEVIQYLLYVSLDVLRYISFLFNFFLDVSLYRELKKEKMKESRDLVVMALGTAHWGKSLKYLRIMK